MATAIILGSGTSNGVPALGVEYSPAFLANPKNHRMRPAILLEAESGNVLVDAGPEIRLQLLREGVKSVDALIVTHTHADHIMGMDDLRAFSGKGRPPLPVYAWPEYQQDIRRVFGYAFQSFGPEIEVPRFDLRDLPPFLEVCGLRIEVLPVPHGPWRVAALRIGDLAYVTDVSDIPAEVAPRLTGLRTLILDAVRYRPHPNHLHFERAVETARSLGAATTYFTHLSHDFDHDEVERHLDSAIRLAYDGLRIPLQVPREPIETKT